MGSQGRRFTQHPVSVAQLVSPPQSRMSTWNCHQGCSFRNKRWQLWLKADSNRKPSRAGGGLCFTSDCFPGKIFLTHLSTIWRQVADRQGSLLVPSVTLQCRSPTETAVSRRLAVTASPLPKLSSHLCSHLKSHLLPSDASLSTFRCTPRPGHTGRSRAQEVPTSPTRGDASPSLLTPDSGVYSFPAHPRSQIHTKETEKRVYSYKAAPERQTRALLSPFQQTGAPCPTLTPPTHGRSPPSATPPGQHLLDVRAE